jgi:hypothetical protein
LSFVISPFTGSNIDPFHLLPVQVPAGAVAEVRKQGVNAGQCLRLVEIELGLTALLRHGVIALDAHSSEWRAIPHDLVTDSDIVTDVENARQDQCNEK